VHLTVKRQRLDEARQCHYYGSAAQRSPRDKSISFDTTQRGTAAARTSHLERSQGMRTAASAIAPCSQWILGVDRARDRQTNWSSGSHFCTRHHIQEPQVKESAQIRRQPEQSTARGEKDDDTQENTQAAAPVSCPRSDSHHLVLGGYFRESRENVRCSIL
jgi:hypothetical protein